MITSSIQGLGAVGNPSAYTNMIAFLASDDSSYCTGNTYVVDGGVMAALVTG